MRITPPATLSPLPGSPISSTPEDDNPIFDECLEHADAIDLHVAMYKPGTFDDFIDTFGGYDKKCFFMWAPTE